MKPEQATYLFIHAFVDDLIRSGVTDAVICPGSRSTPLAMLLAEREQTHHDLKTWLHIDERSAAFFALGMAKTSQRPVVIICTSGTATANFLPAVVEAHYARVPLILLTADRPPELRDIGAPQTIDQIKLFGDHVKWFVEMPVPDATPDLLRYARAMANRAVAEASNAPAAPVHLNFPLREPLVPIPPTEPSELTDQSVASPVQPATQFFGGSRTLDPSDIRAIAALLENKPNGLIICGNEYRHDPHFAARVSELALRLGYPLLADPLSGVRAGAHSGAHVIDAYDAFLRDPRIGERLIPEVIIRFGGVPTSKPLLQYIQKHPAALHLVVDGGSAWNDAALRASMMLRADSRRFCEMLLEAWPTPPTSTPPTSTGSLAGWMQNWAEINRCTQQAITTQVERFEALFEGRVFMELSALLPADAILFASSSMPVRDLDTFFPRRTGALRVLANRGANGIDGVVSSALGASAATAGKLVLVIGDLAFYHDMNGLLAAKLHQLDATIILINNDGGGIFSFLPQAAHPAHFEQLFGTPTGLEFRHAAALYGATWHPIETWAQFREAVPTSLQAGGLHLLELKTRRDTNVTMHRQIWAAVQAALE